MYLSNEANNEMDAGKIRRLWLLSALRLLLASILTLSLALRFSTDIKRFSDVQPPFIAAMYALTALAGLRALGTKALAWRGLLFAQLMLDVVLIGLLVASLGGSDGGYAILYAMPIVAAATLLTRPLALFIASISVISLMLDALRRSLLLTQSVDWLLLSVYGIGCFVGVAALRLAAERAERNETLTRQTASAAMLIQELREQHLQEETLGWLVLDEHGTVKLLNNVARNLAWQAHVLLEVEYQITPDGPLSSWLTASQCADESTLIWPSHAHTEATAHSHHKSPPRLHLKPSELPHLNPMRALTLELASSREARQHNAQLTVMGRISASIAHEIRNPLGAISQAAELIQEGGSLSPADAPLLAIVLENSQRIDRIVRNLLTWSRGMQANPSEFSPNTQLAKLVCELTQTKILSEYPERVVFQPLDFNMPHCAAYTDHIVRFDTDHLYQIINNLLSNAARYAQLEPASIVVALRPRGKHVAVCVMDNGPAVDIQVATHLFEPFQTTSKQGTGLGLYLCREYALANHGLLELFDNLLDTPDINTADHMYDDFRTEPWFTAPYTKAFVLSLPWKG